jgi:hypothetical protein
VTRRYVTASLGEPGFALFLREVYRAGVISHAELCGWLELHGRVLRLGEPLDTGKGVDEDAFAALEAELRGAEPTE